MFYKAGRPKLQFVAMLADLVEGQPRRVEIGVTKIMVLRLGDAIRAFTAECPHAKAPLDQGAVCGNRLVCPWHKAVFSLDDGAVLEPPALDRLTRYPVQVEQGAVMVGANPIAEEAVEAMPADTMPGPGVMLVVGGGAAGAAAVSALREFGFGGRVVLAAGEPGAPYDRTALSKFVMAGVMPPDGVPAVRDPAWLDEHRIECRHGVVTRLDAAARQAWFEDGTMVDYTAALVATGGAPRRLDITGAQLAGVHILRSAADAAAIVAEVREGVRVVILGSSFIGLEVASALRERNAEVTVVSPEDLPFGRQFRRRIGAMFRRMHEAHGVAFHTGQASRLAGTGRVQAVIVGQRALPADLVIVGIGVQPATSFVEGVDKGHDGGIVVDAGMRAAEGLYAAGDIAAFPWHGAPTRIEHWRVAQQHARIAARNMLGGHEGYAGVPFFWTYHYGRRFEYFGHAEHWDCTMVDGDLDSGRFVAMLVRADTVAAVVACGREQETGALIERMREPLMQDEAMGMLRRG